MNLPQSKKKIYLFADAPFRDRKFQCSWDDVFIKLKYKRKRKTFYPCLISLCELESELFLDKDCQTQHPELNYFEDIARLENIKTLFQNSKEKYFIDDEGEVPANIYINEEFIDREIAERAIEFFLKKKGFLSAGTIPAFKWNNPKFFITPISLNLR